MFADDADEEAKAQLADVLEQLGFGSENVTWRNFYLAGALELREGAFGTPTRTGKSSLSRYIRVSQILDALAIAIEAPKAWDLDLELDLVIVDLDERHRVTLRNGVLIHRTVGEEVGAAATTVRVAKPRLLRLLAGDAGSPGIEVDGDPQVLRALLGVASSGDPDFAIVTP